jgi:demethylmenaquinone methyltransferase/2-methoxy-6-polyprenyl-1,4-benzoquinol methylase
MSNLSGNERYNYVQNTFSRIAGRYDLLNRLMTLGQDKNWRHETIGKLQPQNLKCVLDIGSGTGDFAIELKETWPELTIVAADFTPEMVRIGKKRYKQKEINWVIADAQHLPFKKETFDGVISGYLFRNVPDINLALKEQNRVLRAAGHFAALDTTPPAKNLLLPFIKFQFHFIIPLLGKIIAGDSEAYQYLPDSTENFLPAEKLAERIREHGFVSVHFIKKMFGTMAMHWGLKKP